MRADLRDSLDYNQAYWLAMQTADDLGREGDEISLRTDLGARAYDVFGTANFFNFKPWAASIEYLLGHGIDRIAEHDAHLVARLVEGLDPDKYELISPRQGPERSTLVLISHRTPRRNRDVYAALERGLVCGAFRRGRLRISPHLYNTVEDIDRALSILNAA